MGVGTLQESPLHAALKAWLQQPGDGVEVPVDGYVVDLVRDGLLIEVQTGSFSSIRRKLHDLLDVHPIWLVVPVPLVRWIVRVDAAGVQVSRRRSPKRGALVDAFAELVHVVSALGHPNLTVQLAGTHEDELRVDGGRRRRRGRAPTVSSRRLVEVATLRRVADVADWAAFVPAGLPAAFTTAELAVAIGRPRRLAQQMAYTLRGVGALQPVGKRGNAIVYARSAAGAPGDSV